MRRCRTSVGSADNDTLCSHRNSVTGTLGCNRFQVNRDAGCLRAPGGATICRLQDDTAVSDCPACTAVAGDFFEISRHSARFESPSPEGNIDESGEESDTKHFVCVWNDYEAAASQTNNLFIRRQMPRLGGRELEAAARDQLCS